MRDDIGHFYNLNDMKGRSSEISVEEACTCSSSAGGIPCHNQWCEVRSNATHIAACAVVRSDKQTKKTQTLACVRVNARADLGYCTYDVKRDATKCWCTRGDYCNVDLVDRIRDKRLSNEDDYDESAEEDVEEEPDFTVETNTEFNENNNEIDEKNSEETVESKRFESSPVGVIVDMRKPVETKKQMSAEEAALPPWRRMNPINAGNEWKPPPPPPMPAGNLPVVRPTTTTTFTTTTTTTTPRPTTTTTTTLSYEEIRRQHEERRRQMEAQREAELRRRAELERQRMEEERRRLVQQEQTTKTTTTTTTTTTAPPTTTTTPSIIYPPPAFRTAPPRETTTTTTTTTTPSTAIPEKKTYESYSRNWRPQHRRPLDLNPTQISVTNFSAIVYPPRGFVKASTTTTPSSSSTTTTTTTTTTTPRPTTTTTTTTVKPTTTTPPIIYPPAGFKKATKVSTTTTTEVPPSSTSEIAYNLPDDEDEGVELNDDEKTRDMEMIWRRKMVEMPKLESSESEDIVKTWYTPKPAAAATAPPPQSVEPSVRTPVEKMNEYKKLLGEKEPSASSSIILPSFISIIIFAFFLL
ncbi:hypothetical protein CRE_22102 [Caenorhabditis remanei]|uniref:Uncharacterized protein n=1 Tax=Caenorhabditis remanei TaxID=31234 RepID=E3NCM3_CAERE|nr:hypothetical protein CRE_22102 [Caenorhabditis remanei]